MALSRHLFFFFFLFSSVLNISTSKMIFNFTSFAPNAQDIIFSGDAFASGEKVIQLTRNQLDQDLLQSAGRITYASPIQIWDPATRVVADFCTQFKFVIDGLDKEKYGDGLAFFMAPVGSDLPQNSTGQWLGLFNSTTNGMASTQVVAVEFDTFQNPWDPSPNHIGIDINSIVSVTTKNWETEIRNGSAGSAWVGYNSTKRSLYAFLTYDKWSFAGKPSISYEVDLTDFLPDKIVIGFSASTGASTELHKILSWNFQSTMTLGSDTHRSGNKRRQWVILLVVTMGVLVAALGFGWIVWRREKGQCRDDTVLDASIEDKFVKGTGPRRFTYKELALATKDFSEEGKLGQGGFGGVYKGTLSNNSTAFETVAVKKIARGSKQGRKEYVTEVTVISRLRHRNLVKLIGWCHEYGEFHLVYEYMPNGSLDSYLFGKKLSLKWKVRYKIALGLASALLYLHEEWEQCVIHRDIKSSNIMLDSNFNTKLGDFGLARFIDHELGSQTTVVAGTMGYLAPECITTGKASKESDVYSFGVVALEIACGRKPVDTRADERKVRLVEWVWDLYGKGRLFEAVDERLSNDFDEKQMERLMIVGLCCVHPDHKLRPSIRQVIQVLNVEAPLPSLPAKMPVAVYYAPSFSMSHFNYTSNMSITNWTTGGSHSSCNTSSTASSRASSTKSFERVKRKLKTITRRFTVVRPSLRPPERQRELFH